MLANYRDRIAAGNSDLVAVDDSNSRQTSAQASIIRKPHIPRELVRHLSRAEERSVAFPGSRL
jgi:hypothetical protein